MDIVSPKHNENLPLVQVITVVVVVVVVVDVSNVVIFVVDAVGYSVYIIVTLPVQGSHFSPCGIEPPARYVAVSPELDCHGVAGAGHRGGEAGAAQLPQRGPVRVQN